MPTITAPNISTSDPQKVTAATHAVEGSKARVLDVHSDGVHNRTVLTVCGSDSGLVAGMVALAEAMKSTGLSRHSGVHPRLGGLDVCPFVPHYAALVQAVDLAHRTGRLIGEECGIPVYFYGFAARRQETRELPNLRRGGLEKLAARARSGLVPDEGPALIDLDVGVTCVGARTTLIAFNVWLHCDEATARVLAERSRTAGGGPPSVRALGWSMSEDPPLSQISMNLIDPQVTGIDQAFDHVAKLASRFGVGVAKTELVGLVPERYLPDSSAPASKLLITPARRLEDRLSIDCF